MNPKIEVAIVAAKSARILLSNLFLQNLKIIYTFVYNQTCASFILIYYMKFNTKTIHGGQKIDPAFNSVMQPIYQTSTYAQERPGVNLSLIHI